MSKTFDILSEALNEAITDTKEKRLTRHTKQIYIPPITSHSSDEIKTIRHNLGLTQSLFAQYLGVSPKTVESWESGKNKPSGPSNRLLGLLAAKKVSISEG